MPKDRRCLDMLSEIDAKSMLPSIESIISALIMCRNEKDLQTSLRLHTCICTNGLECHMQVGKYLISLFVELDNIWYAHQAFEKALHVDGSSWNALICGYVKNGDPLKAVRLYQKMKEDHCPHHPCGYTFVALLKACTILEDIERGSQIHADLSRFGSFQVDIFVGATLIDMYAKLGSLGKAKDVFDGLDKQNTVLWNALISGLIDHGQGEEALQLFEQMQENKVSLDAITLVCVLKASSSNISDIIKCQSIHADMTKKGFLAEENIFISSALLDTYMKCGISLDEAQYVFNKIPIQNAVSWTSLIAGYTEHGLGNTALHYYRQMQNEGFSPHISTFITILKACRCLGSSEDGQEIHAEIIKKGISGEILIENSLIDMYGKCGLLTEAKFVFHRLPSPTVVSWTVLMSGCSEHGSDHEVLEYLEKMQQEGIALDSPVFIHCLKACRNLRMLAEGLSVHSQIVSQGFVGTDSVAVSLVQMYAGCGSLVEAHALFDSLHERTTILWNVMIAAYVESGLATEALACFAAMRCQGFVPDGVTFLYISTVYGSIRDKDRGRELHAEVCKRGSDHQHGIGNTLAAMYAGCGLLDEAEDMLVENLPRHHMLVGNLPRHHMLVGNLPRHHMLADAWKLLDGVSTARDRVSWAIVVKGYLDHGFYEQALECLRDMKSEGLPLDEVAFLAAFQACGSVGASAMGLELHSDAVKMGFDSDPAVGNSVLDLYATCGFSTEATRAFDALVRRDLVSWNAAIACYSQHGDFVGAFGLFEAMIRGGGHPNSLTFLGILSACSHSGLAEYGFALFASMSCDYFLDPSSEHYTCIVDSLARVGLVKEAMWAIENMPLHPCRAMWRVVLGACEKPRDAHDHHRGLGIRAFKHALQLNEMDSAAYVALSNILAFG